LEFGAPHLSLHTFRAFLSLIEILLDARTQYWI